MYDKVWVIYLASGNKQTHGLIWQNIQDQLNFDAKNDKIWTIIMDDFNTVPNNRLDREPMLKYAKSNFFINKLQDNLFEDTHRIRNGSSKEFTWTDGTTKTRIDHI